MNVDSAGLRMKMHHILYAVIFLQKWLDSEKWYPPGLSHSILCGCWDMRLCFFTELLSKPDWLRPHSHNSLCKQTCQFFFCLWDTHTNTLWVTVTLLCPAGFFFLMSWLHNKKTSLLCLVTTSQCLFLTCNMIHISIHNSLGSSCCPSQQDWEQR